MIEAKYEIQKRVTIQFSFEELGVKNKKEWLGLSADQKRDRIEEASIQRDYAFPCYVLKQISNCR